MKKNRTKTICPICHDTIRTRHVFSKDNQVFLKREDPLASTGQMDDDWFPVNFQWMPVMAMKNNLENQYITQHHEE